MTEISTSENVCRLDSDIEIWLEPDAYCPRVMLKRPKTFKNSVPALSQSGLEVQCIVKNPEAIFIEDLIYNFFASKSISIDDKKVAAKHLTRLAARINEMIYENQDAEEYT